MKPMRMQAADAQLAARLMLDDGWVAEQKVDGTRTIVTVTPAGTTWTNSQGEKLNHATSALHLGQLEKELPAGEYAIDCELLWTGHLWAFDLVMAAGVDVTHLPFADRRQILERLFDFVDAPHVHLIPQAVGTDAKRKLLQTMDDLGCEGIMLKDLTAPYQPGGRVTSQLKLKFRPTVDCVVTARNVNGKLNARLALYEDGKLRDVGGCSMIGKPDAQVGDVVEVKYAYATEELDLYQPSLFRLRPDKPAEECLLDQLRPVNKEVLSQCG